MLKKLIIEIEDTTYLATLTGDYYIITKLMNNGVCSEKVYRCESEDEVWSYLDKLEISQERTKIIELVSIEQRELEAQIKKADADEFNRSAKLNAENRKKNAIEISRKGYLELFDDLCRTARKVRLIRGVLESKGSLGEVATVKLLELKEKRTDLENQIEQTLNCCIRYNIGFRVYYSWVTKIGKRYYSNGKCLTKSNGYSCIEEIDFISSVMHDEMLSDSYYY